MRVSRQNLNQNLQKEILILFYQLVADLKSSTEAEAFFEGILSPAELTAVAKRLAIAHYLENRRSYQNIRNNLKVSSATIAAIDKARKATGYQMAMKKIEADRWASGWADKISKLFSKK